MKIFIVSLSALIIFVSISSLAAGLCKPGDIFRPSNEYCWTTKQKTVNDFERKEIRFQLENASSRFETIVVVDNDVEVSLSVTQQAYRMAIYKRSDIKRERPLGKGRYERSGLEFDFNAAFEVFTDDAKYSVNCITEELR